MATGFIGGISAKKEGVYGKTTGAVINLKDSNGNNVKVNENQYVYMNETTQLVLDNPTENTFDRTTPVQVVNQAYDTSGNGGRKLVRLSNGWLVALVVDSANKKYIFEVSKDDGLTFSQLAYAVAYSTNINGNFASLVANGNIITAILGNMELNVIRYWTRSYTFDATLITNVDINTNTTNVIKGVVDYEIESIGGHSLTIDSNGYLHATWASKKSTYPNSFNIRYSKSTDGGVTWASPTQVSAYNTVGFDYKHPTIFISNGQPSIICSRVQSTTNGLRLYKYNGTLWSNESAVATDGGAYPQSSPSATVDSNGVIHVAWHGTDAGDATYPAIRYAKSVDNGLNWSAVIEVDYVPLQFCQRASVSTDINNNIYIGYDRGKNADGFSTNIYFAKSADGGVSFPIKTNITNNPTSGTGNTSYQCSLCNNYNNFENPILIYSNLINSDVKFYGKWTESNSPQIIPSLSTATSESQLQAIGVGQLKSYGSAQKFYTGFKSNKSIGFTPF